MSGFVLNPRVGVLRCNLLAVVFNQFFKPFNITGGKEGVNIYRVDKRFLKTFHICGSLVEERCRSTVTRLSAGECKVDLVAFTSKARQFMRSFPKYSLGAQSIWRASAIETRRFESWWVKSAEDLQLILCDSSKRDKTGKLTSRNVPWA